jgi:hypothetical protein
MGLYPPPAVILGLVPRIPVLDPRGATTNSSGAANRDSRDKPENDFVEGVVGLAPGFPLSRE